MYMYIQFAISIFALKAASKNDSLTIALMNTSRVRKDNSNYTLQNLPNIINFQKEKKY